MRANKKVINFIAEEFQKINNSSYRINSGGCGIFAEFAYRSLVKVGLKPKLAVLTRPDEMKKETVEENLKNNAGAFDIPFSHIVLVVGKHYIDSTGAYKDHTKINSNYADHLCVVGMDVELLKDWNKNPYNWNSVFNRNQVPSIKKQIKAVEKKLTEFVS